VLGLGYAFSDCPWLRSDTVFSVNLNNQQEVRLFLRGLFGFGGQELDMAKRFNGYGCIAHRSGDFGFRVSHLFEGVGTLSIELARRIYAENYPKQVNYLAFEFLYPFGI